LWGFLFGGGVDEFVLDEFSVVVDLVGLGDLDVDDF
jgi:hypothetical protein